MGMAKSAITTAFTASLFPELCPVTAAVDRLAESGVEERGAIFTRREVVEFILDLLGYSASRPLHRLRLLEPSFGGGDFLLPAVDRLLDAWKVHGAGDPRLLHYAIRAVELHRVSYQATWGKLIALLETHGLPADAAKEIANAWLINGDYLLTALDGTFDVVIGNPPYIRQELIDDALVAEYRRRYRTLYDRADIYIPFIERSLLLLRPEGALGFICADRWMKNRYGGPLRRLIADRFHLRAFVDMVDTPAFHTDVVAYPAIVVIGNERGRTTRVAYRPEINSSALAKLSTELTASIHLQSSERVREIQAVTQGDEPWILESSEQLELVRRIEMRCPAIEDAGCKVGIGVATGADKAFIGPFDALDVEESRKLPLVMTRDIEGGAVRWRGLGVVNPFTDTGSLVDLGQFPRLREYLEARKDVIARRHVATKSPANWYRTIDRITPSLAGQPKLLIPDIKGAAHVVYEDGRLYPHHNLYYITSESWDLRALQAVMRSGIARLFVSAYSTKMRGGYLRFQAQYLRRIRLPRWEDLSPGLQGELVTSSLAGDLERSNGIVAEMYGLDQREQALIEEHGSRNVY